MGRWLGLSMLLFIAALAACGRGETGADRTGEERAEAASPSPTVAAGPSPNATAFGTVRIEFVPYGDGAVLPDPRIRPLRITMSIQSMEDGSVGQHDIADPNPVGQLVRDEYSLAALDFALELAPGVYRLRALTASHRDLGPGPVELVFQSREFTVLASGCVYVGRIVARYYRLPPGDLDSQVLFIGELTQPGDSIRWTFIEVGGLVPESGAIEVPPATEWPQGAEACSARPAE